MRVKDLTSSKKAEVESRSSLKEYIEVTHDWCVYSEFSLCLGILGKRDKFNLKNIAFVCGKYVKISLENSTYPNLR